MMPYPTKRQWSNYFKKWKYLFLIMGFQLLTLFVTIPKSRMHFLIMLVVFLFINVGFVFFNINWTRTPKNGVLKENLRNYAESAWEKGTEKNEKENDA